MRSGCDRDSHKLLDELDVGAIGEFAAGMVDEFCDCGNGIIRRNRQQLRRKRGSTENERRLTAKPRCGRLVEGFDLFDSGTGLTMPVSSRASTSVTSSCARAIVATAVTGTP